MIGQTEALNKAKAFSKSGLLDTVNTEIEIYNHDESSSDFSGGMLDTPCIQLFLLPLIGFLPNPFYLCKWILFYLQVSKVQSHLGLSNSVSPLSYLSEICTHIYNGARQ